MKIYLDIDGVLLTKEGKLANFAKEFLQKATANHEVFWLTTHCKGEAKTALEQFAGHVSPEVFALLEQIKPTNWQTLKTEAIDFDSDFLWFDDFVLQAELQKLSEAGKENSLILVDLISDENFLNKAVPHLR